MDGDAGARGALPARDAPGRSTRSPHCTDQRSRSGLRFGILQSPLLIHRLTLALVVTLAAAGCRTTARVRYAGAYRFQCDPPDARVIVDEVDMGPCVLWQSRWMGLSQGTHRVQVTRAAYLPSESDLVPNGRRVTVDVHLRRVPE